MDTLATLALALGGSWASGINMYLAALTIGIAGLMRRARDGAIREVILATNATVDGQTTAHYLADRLAEIEGVKVTRLAHGVPVGGELDYLDEGTLSQALKARTAI